MRVDHSAGVVSSDEAAVFFDRLTPANAGARPSLVMIHGGGHTGSCYLVTPDGRPGWAPYLAKRGYPVTVPDWPGHGRSGGLDLNHLTGEQVCQGLAGMVTSLKGPVVLLTHSMGGSLGWRLMELCREQVVAVIAIAPGEPGNISPKPVIESEHAGTLVVRTRSRTATMRLEGPTLFDRSFVVNKLVGKSRQFPREHLDTYARSLTPTGSRLIYERANVRGSQVRVQEPSCLTGIPIFVVTGSDDLDHTRSIDGALADWLAAQGAVVEFAWLPDHGIDGNGHMLMLERNSDLIADLLLDWLARQGLD